MIELIPFADDKNSNGKREHTTEEEDLKKDPDYSKKNAKKPRFGGYKEDPFVYLKADDEETDFKEVKEFFGLDEVKKVTSKIMQYLNVQKNRSLLLESCPFQK